MARQEALLKLHKALELRRKQLFSKLSDDINSLHSKDSRDSADEAFDAGNEDINCQLAELESNELTQIERALTKLKKGCFGACESCNKKIPVGRLNALPYTMFCIECQKEMEDSPTWNLQSSLGGWAKVSDRLLTMEDSMESVNLADYEN